MSGFPEGEATLFLALDVIILVLLACTRPAEEAPVVSARQTSK
jgi:hypothetical protein